MLESFYKNVIEKSSIGYAYHKIICDNSGVPCDYEFIEVNAAFENLTGLKGVDIIGKRITMVLPGFLDDEFDWIGVYGEIALNGGEKEVEQFSQSLNKWYKVTVYSPEKYYFITLFVDTTKEMNNLAVYKKMALLSEEFLQMKEQELDFQKITDDFVKMCGAKYGVFNLFDEDGESFTTKAISGDKGVIKKTIDMLGFKIKDKKWDKDLVRAEKIKDSIITRFASMAEISAGVVPKSMLVFFEKTFKVGQVVLVKITRNDIMIGDFTLIMAKNILFEQDTAAELYTRQLGLVIERKSAEAQALETKEYFEQMFITSPDASVVTRADDGRIENLNEGFETLSGYTREEALGNSTLILNLYKYPEERQRLVDELKTQGHFRSDATVFQRKDGSLFTGLFSARIFMRKGVAYISSNIRDITYRKQMEDALKDSEEKYRLLTENVSDVIWVFSMVEERFTYVSPSVLSLRGFTPEEAMQETFKESLTPESYITFTKTVSEYAKKMFDDLHADISFSVEVRQPCKNGNPIWVEISAKFRYGLEHDLDIIGASRNIEGRKKAEEEINRLSFHDSLTGLYNRRYFDKEMGRLNDEQYFPLTLIMADVNGLKLTNDAFGHKAGDLLLEKVAKIIKKECRTEDIVARIGGDEFVVLLPETDAMKADVIITRINKAIASEKVENIIVSVSLGYAVKQYLSENMTDVFKKAEDEMYRHKLTESSGMRNKTIDLIMNTLYERNSVEKHHSVRTGNICEAIASKMDIQEDEIIQIRLAGLMHDIGEIGIDEKILNTTRALTEEDWKEIRRHPEIGYRILSSSNEFAEIAEWVLQHHERMDGEGYPSGVSGEGISTQARILAIADAFDAMTTDRIFKKKISEEAAIEEIKRCSGTQFDANIAKVFVEGVLGRQWK